MTKKSKKKKIIIWSAVALVVVVVIVFLSTGNGEKANMLTLEKGNVALEVSVTGKVIPAKNVDLAFETSGRVSRVNVDVGDEVYAGKTLVQLENSELYARVAEAEATLKAQEAKLVELERGPREEETSVKNAELSKAKQDLENYYTSIPGILNDAFAKANDAVRTKTDELFTNDDTNTPRLTFTVTDSQAEVNAITLRVASGLELSIWRNELKTISENSSTEILMNALQKAMNHLSIIRNFMTSALDVMNTTSGISDTNIAAYKLNIYTGRTNVNTSYTTLNTQIQSVESQRALIERIQKEYELLLSGNTEEQIDAQKAVVDQASASLAYYRSQLNKTSLSAPFGGRVTKVDVKIGDVVSAGVAGVSLIGSEKFEVEANIAESDISKVKIGNMAKVTLDAYGKNVIFDATVVQIDLSETVIEGVSTYKTKFQFMEDDERILSGLTADIDILSENKEGILFVPTRNIITEGRKQYVLKVLGDGSTEKTEIITGLRGSDGRTEVISGVSEGDILSLD